MTNRIQSSGNLVLQHSGSVQPALSRWLATLPAVRSPMLLVWTLAISALVTPCLADEPPAKEKLETGFELLFDGKTLDGWEGDLDFFRVENGAIVAGNLKENIPHNEFLCSKKIYGDFELKLEVKIVGQGDNAGVQFRSKRVADEREVSGYQCDAGIAWDRPVWGGLYDESRRREMLAEGPKDKVPAWLKTNDWNELHIKAVGERIQLLLNGHQTVDFKESDKNIPRTGIIGLQIHSGPPTEAWYRNIRIRQLQKAAVKK